MTSLDTDPTTTSEDLRATLVRPQLTPFTIVAIVAPGLVVFALPAVSMIGRNSEYFGNDYSAGRLMYALASIVIVVGFVLWALSATAVGRYLFLSYVLITPGWFLYSTSLSWRRVLSAVWSPRRSSSLAHTSCLVHATLISLPSVCLALCYSLELSQRRS